MLLVMGCGTAAPRLDQSRMSPDDAVFLIQGTSGFLALYLDPVRDGLKQAGVPGRIIIHRWHRKRIPFVVVWNDVEYQAVEAGADDLAGLIEEHVASHPGARVHLVGQSAGTEVACRALELLRPTASVETVTFLGGSCARDRDLRAALRVVDGHLYNIYSTFDFLLLAGIPIAGTTDRRRCSAAGRSGLRLPPGATPADEQLYRDKVVNIGWNVDLWRYGHDGQHIGGTGRRFARDYLSLLMAGMPPPAGEIRRGARP